MEYSKGYATKTAEEKRLEVEKFFEDVKRDVKNYTVDEESLKELLDWQQKFYTYSLGNTILIQQQFRGAEAVGSFKFWSNNGYSINKGETGIKILARCKASDYFIRDDEKIPIKQATKQEREKIDSGEIDVYQGAAYYKQGHVFDISQTNCPLSDIPKLFPNRWLEGEIQDYKVFYDSVKKVAEDMNVKIIENPERELGVAKGVSYTGKNQIAINPRNSELQNAKTLIHELAHQKLHGPDSKLTPAEKEFQAELTAYTVCKHFGIDTSEYSLKYIHDWTKGHEDIMDTQILLSEASQASRYFMDIMATEPLMQQKLKEVATNELHDITSVRQIDRMRNVQYHIYQRKDTNTYFIGCKEDAKKIKQMSKDLQITEAKASVIELNRPSERVITNKKEVIEL